MYCTCTYSLYNVHINCGSLKITIYLFINSLIYMYIYIYIYIYIYTENWGVLYIYNVCKITRIGNCISRLVLWRIRTQ